jgi:hypothetical protein
MSLEGDLAGSPDATIPTTTIIIAITLPIVISVTGPITSGIGATAGVG